MIGPFKQVVIAPKHTLSPTQSLSRATFPALGPIKGRSTFSLTRMSWTRKKQKTEENFNLLEAALEGLLIYRRFLSRQSKKPSPADWWLFHRDLRVFCLLVFVLFFKWENRGSEKETLIFRRPICPQCWALKKIFLGLSSAFIYILSPVSWFKIACPLSPCSSEPGLQLHQVSPDLPASYFSLLFEGSGPPGALNWKTNRKEMKEQSSRCSEGQVPGTCPCP